jgi:hypothetical protein
LFFASVANFNALFDPQEDPEDVEVDFQVTRFGKCGIIFQYSKLEDLAAVAALNDLDTRYVNAKKRIHFKNISDKSYKYIQFGGPLANNINTYTALP